MEQKNARKFGLIGKNIDYSFSRNYFASKFKKEGIANCIYDNYDCATDKEVRKTLERNDLSGLNVTIPYKEVAFEAVDGHSEQALAIGAVNTIVFESNGKTTGHNTDAYGFEKALLEHWKKNAVKALILGTGGASKAVHYVLEQHGLEVQFVSRSGKNNSLRYEELTEQHIQEHQLIVNCTPLGTHPNVEEAPALPYEALTKDHFLFDLIYNPAETRFLQLGKKFGAQGANGANMLVYQAEASWDIWNS